MWDFIFTWIFRAIFNTFRDTFHLNLIGSSSKQFLRYLRARRYKFLLELMTVEPFFCAFRSLLFLHHSHSTIDLFWWYLLVLHYSVKNSCFYFLLCRICRRTDFVLSDASYLCSQNVCDFSTFSFEAFSRSSSALYKTSSNSRSSCRLLSDSREGKWILLIQSII